LPDEAARLAAELLRLAAEQDVALAADDWDGFLVLAEQRAAVVVALDSLLTGRQDLIPVLQAVAAKDHRHQARITEVSAQVQHEIADVRPQQVAMHAYFSGVAVADAPEARFIDRQDGQ
jgi:hypothetical protein